MGVLCALRFHNAARAGRWRSNMRVHLGNLSHGRCEDRNGLIPCQCCRRREDRIVSRCARVLGDPMALCQVVAGDFGLGYIEGLPDARIRKIESAQSCDACPADPTDNFRCRDRARLVMAEQLCPRTILARRRVPYARTTGFVIPPGRHRWISCIEQFAIRRALMPDGRRQQARGRSLARNLQTP
jgi:hypothetical protein